MGIDYRNIIMYGKEFDGFACAAECLLSNGKITEAQCDEFVDNHEFWCDDEENIVCYLSWNTYSEYSNSRAGVVGIELSAEKIYTNPEATKKLIDEMDKLMTGCEWHEFVKVY